MHREAGRAVHVEQIAQVFVGDFGAGVEIPKRQSFGVRRGHGVVAVGADAGCHRDLLGAFQLARAWPVAASNSSALEAMYRVWPAPRDERVPIGRKIDAGQALVVLPFLISDCAFRSHKFTVASRPHVTSCEPSGDKAASAIS